MATRPVAPSGLGGADQRTEVAGILDVERGDDQRRRRGEDAIESRGRAPGQRDHADWRAHRAGGVEHVGRRLDHLGAAFGERLERLALGWPGRRRRYQHRIDVERRSHRLDEQVPAVEQQRLVVAAAARFAAGEHQRMATGGDGACHGWLGRVADRPAGCVKAILPCVLE